MSSFGAAFQRWLAVAASMKLLHELLANGPGIVYTGLMLSHYFAQQHNCGLQETSHPEGGLGGWKLLAAIYCTFGRKVSYSFLSYFSPIVTYSMSLICKLVFTHTCRLTSLFKLINQKMTRYMCQVMLLHQCRSKTEINVSLRNKEHC